MRICWLHLRVALLEILRSPAFLVPTALFPTMLFLFFGVASADTWRAANFIMASFAVFGVMGVCFYQFGVGIAEDRMSPWEDYLHTLPVTVVQRFTARIMAAMVVALTTLLLLFLTAAVTTPIQMSAMRFAGLIAALAVTGIPFALFGVALGYWLPVKAAVPLANLIYLPLSFAGGIWLPPDQLPPAVEAVSVWLPSRMAGEICWAAVLDGGWKLWDFAGLALYSAVAFVVGIWGYRRNERRAYG